tara:strand:- start:698 stop:1741 length:1044 start_codon:yes stop_codon:yes gene_type:complete
MSKAAELAALIGSQTALSNRNFVINGGMNVAQYSTSAAVTTSSGYFTVDRFRTTATSDTAGRLTQSQATITDLPGFANAIKLDCTTADTSIAAGEILVLATRFEGQNLQSLAKGTSSAKAVTVSFYAKGTAKKYMCELTDQDNTRSIRQQFTVSSSWQRFSIVFPGDTTGAFDDDNALSSILGFWLHAGSTYSGGSYTANTWASTVTNTRASGIDSFFSSTDNELFITGLQMEIGSVATAFEHRSFGEELQLCKRYFQVHDDMQLRGNPDGGFERIEIYCPLGVSMRANPSRVVITEGNSTNIRSSTTTYSGFILANRTAGCTLSLESNSAGLASFDNRTEALDAEL